MSSGFLSTFYVIHWAQGKNVSSSVSCISMQLTHMDRTPVVLSQINKLYIQAKQFAVLEPEWLIYTQDTAA